MSVIERLAEKYHVYGVVMRFDGKADELNADGTTNWSRQWGKRYSRFRAENELAEVSLRRKMSRDGSGLVSGQKSSRLPEKFREFLFDAARSPAK